MLDGKWTVVTSMGTVNLLLNLKVNGSTLTGSIWYRNKSVKIIGGKIRDKSFSFQALVTTKHGIIPVFVQGYFVDATHITGIVKCKLGSLRFTAVKN
jgi:hypothetical protein